MHDPLEINIVVDSLDHIPSYSRPGDAGLDLRSSVNEVLEYGDYKLIPTGTMVAIPNGYAGLVLPRSGLAMKYGVSVLNSPGLVDPGYRGEVKVLLINHGGFTFVIKATGFGYRVRNCDRLKESGGQ